MLSWVHIGDLHAGHDDGGESLARVGRIVDLINEQLVDTIDFVYLPGDSANHGLPAEYAGIRAQLERLKVPYRGIPGDHDFEPGDLEAYSSLPGSACPHAWRLDGRRCLFLDIVSHGKGGPDFRLGDAQWHWLERELEKSLADEHRPVVFMHAYPGDLAERGAELAELFARRRVAFVDTGHTHYNELLNDGEVLYGATRSTGQIEEDGGRPGFSIVQLDGDVLSWHFRRLDDPWPVVTITSPPDLRLVARHGAQRSLETFAVRARVLGTTSPSSVVAHWLGLPRDMVSIEGPPRTWQVQVSCPASGWRLPLTVTARLPGGAVVEDTIEPLILGPERDAPLGTDAWAVPAWPERGLLGSQRGPNKGGRKW